MDTNNKELENFYEQEKGFYLKILIGLLVFTAITFVQPYMFFTDNTFFAQMAVAVFKAWLIVIYYMHLRGEGLIGAMVMFSLFIVLVFFIIVGIDVSNFQFGTESFITGQSMSH